MRIADIFGFYLGMRVHPNNCASLKNIYDEEHLRSVLVSLVSAGALVIRAYCC